MQQLDPGKVGLRVPVSCKWKWKGHKTKPKVLNLGKELVEMVALIRLRMGKDKESGRKNNWNMLYTCMKFQRAQLTN